MARTSWRVIGFRHPMRPSRNRLAVWGGLKKVGAVDARQALRILPYSLGNRADLKKMSADIKTRGGQSVLIATTTLEERHERPIMVPVAAREREAGPSERLVMA